jgi:hypothetical protein
VVALFSILGLAVDLNSIVSHELITEISNAAGLNLVDQYIANYTVEELTDLAANGLTPGIKLAADRALFKINGGLATYITLGEGQKFADMDALKAAAVAGDQDAADAYVFLSRGDLMNPTAILAAIAATDAETLQIAYGKLLGGYYGPGSPVGMKTESELLDLVVNGDSLGSRVAAATALTSYWILGADLTIPEVEARILSNTLVHPELALAYQGYLAYLFSL